MAESRHRFSYMSAIFGMAWVVASFVRPEADYVILPVLTAGSFPVSYRLAVGPVPAAFAAGAAVAGVISTAFIALVMNAAGVLAEPTVFPELGAVGQALALGSIGGVVGGVAAAVNLRR